MKFKVKKIIPLILLSSVTTVAVSTLTFNSVKNESSSNDSPLAYLETSDSLRIELEKALEETYGDDYKDILYKNNASIEIANKVNEMFISSSSNELEYPSYIGGMYIDDNNELVIQINESKIPNKKSSNFVTYKSMLNVDEDIKTEYVKYSYNDLDKVNNEITDYYENNKELYYNVSANYIDVVNNRVVVELSDNSLEKQEEFKKNINDSEVIVFNKQEKGSFENEAYNPGQGVAGCTLGFRAKRNNVKGFVTAGHCITMYSLNVGDSYSSYGTIAAYYDNEYADAAFIQTSTDITTNLQYTVYNAPTNIGTTSAGYLVGSMIGKSGAKTKGTTGTIKNLNVTIYVNGEYFRNLIETNYVSDDGDSGAPVFMLSDGKIVGIHKGSRTTGQKYATSYNTVSSYLGISIY